MFGKKFLVIIFPHPFFSLILYVISIELWTTKPSTRKFKLDLFTGCKNAKLMDVYFFSNISWKTTWPDFQYFLYLEYVLCYQQLKNISIVVLFMIVKKIYVAHPLKSIYDAMYLHPGHFEFQARGIDMASYRYLPHTRGIRIVIVFVVALARHIGVWRHSTVQALALRS